MPTAISLCKFVGTISLGLLTGISYTLSTQSLPSLLTLPSAKPAAHTLSLTRKLSTQHVRALSSVATLSLFTAYALSPPRSRHPYLIWTGLVAAMGGGLELFVGDKSGKGVLETEDVNGEQVERRARLQQWTEFVRMGVSGVGFAMGIVGIWGDGA